MGRLDDLMAAGLVRHDVDAHGTRVHVAEMGAGPLVLFVHGFPESWYSWRNQLPAVAAAGYRAAAIDVRGYGSSETPEAIDAYRIIDLVGDCVGVVEALGEERAVIVGHDWGGMVAWQFAMALPRQCSRLVILNLPHPRGLSRELANNPQQQKNSAYARAFQLPGAHKALSAEGLSGWVRNKTARAKYVEAFKRSDFEAMLNYYKKNYPRMPYKEDNSPVVRVQAPVLMFHGLDDRALLPAALNGTWKWVEKDLTLVTVPGAGHFVQQDASELVSRTMKMWLELKTDRRTTPAG